MNKSSLIYVAGHNGLVGGGLLRALHSRGYRRTVTRSREMLDLTQRPAVDKFFADVRPDYVFLAAALVGGIGANMQRPASFSLENLQVQTNVVDAARQAHCQGLLFLGSSCCYPRAAVQPITEAALGTGALEPTNEAYATAKLAGISLLRACRQQYGFRSVVAMPSNLYGPGDSYDVDNAHVLPTLIRRFHEAVAHEQRTVTLWGTGTARREFLHVDDCADACLLLMEGAHSDVFNVGTGSDMTIAELAEAVAAAVGYTGAIEWDGRAALDGMPAKRLDTTRMAGLGWAPRINLAAGLRHAYRCFLAEGT
jgi:GDP-L-fucose synthase